MISPLIVGRPVSVDETVTVGEVPDNYGRAIAVDFFVTTPQGDPRETSEFEPYATISVLARDFDDDAFTDMVNLTIKQAVELRDRLGLAISSAANVMSMHRLK